MAKWIKWVSKQVEMWDEWMKERPPVIQEMIFKFNLRPDNLYKIKSTGQVVMLHSLSEDSTVTVNILADYNTSKFMMGFDRQVFGIDPADLEECDLPEGKEIVDGEPFLSAQE